MPDTKNDILKRIIQGDLSRGGPGYSPGTIGNATAERLGIVAPELLPEGQQVDTRPMAGVQAQIGAGPRDRTAPTANERMQNFSPVMQDSDAYNPNSNPLANPLPRVARGIFGDAAIDAIPSRERPAPPDMADSGIPMPDAPDPQAAMAPQAGLEYAGVPPVDAPVPRADIAFDPDAPQTPQQRAQAGLAAAGMGEDPGYDPMSPELIDPETGERSDEARKLGLLERMFGEKGSDKYKNAGKGLMMAGAAIMSSGGNLGQAIGEGIQAGLMTYDDAMAALREEELEAKKMGMTEEAHAMNMHLNSLRAARMSAVGGGGKSGAVKPEPEYTPTQQGLMLADMLVDQFHVDPEHALRIGAQQAFGLPAGAINPPRQQDQDLFSLGQ